MVKSTPPSVEVPPPDLETGKLAPVMDEAFQRGKCTWDQYGIRTSELKLDPFFENKKRAAARHGSGHRTGMNTPIAAR